MSKITKSTSNKKFRGVSKFRVTPRSNRATTINASTNTSRKSKSVEASTMYEDCDGSLAGLGEYISEDELRDIWEEDHEYDPCMIDYDTFEAWLADTVDSGYISPIEGACNTANIMATDSSDDDEIVWDIANDFSGYSNPITDSWNHDTLLEMGVIANKLGCSLEEAASKMIDILGFEPEDVDIDTLAGDGDPQQIINKYIGKVVQAASNVNPYTKDCEEVTYDVVEAADDVDSDLSGPLDSVETKFLDSVEKTLDKWSREEGWADTIESIVFTRDDDRSGNMYVTVTLKDDGSGETPITDYTVPYTDLTFDPEEVDRDAEYILKSIGEDIPNPVVVEDTDDAEDTDDVESSTNITGTYEMDDLADWEIDTQWDELAHKTVPDSDGFYTDYTMYKWIGDPEDVDDIYICVFGDSDLYYPDSNYPECDFSTSNEEEAWEWFENYNGFDDDDE